MIENNTNATRYCINDNEVYIIKKPLTLRWVKGFKAAFETAKQSSGLMRLGAAIYSGNRLLATGFNIYNKTRPGNVGTREDGSVFDITLHAEQAAINKIKHYDLKKSSLILYVVRVSALGQYVQSQPCNMCINYMKNFGIKRIRFINSDGQPEEMIIK